ncbi:hypothetical protein A3219_12405 [Salmonella enterica]|nr:hypothetical protein A3219_12405 [Salmonella enterica]
MTSVVIIYNDITVAFTNVLFIKNGRVHALLKVQHWILVYNQSKLKKGTGLPVNKKNDDASISI